MVILPHVSLASEWVAIDGGVVEVKLDTDKLESDLWKHINKASKIKFEPKQKYIYQYQAITNKTISIKCTM